jgi:hypothetical protein
VYLVDSYPLRRARVYLPGFGYWSVTAELEGGAKIAAGQAVEVTAGGLVLRGTVETATDFTGVVHVVINPGGGRWQTVIPFKGYRSGAGIKLAEVLGDIASAIREQARVDGAANRPLGYAWPRAAGMAAAAIQAATLGAHWVDAGGVLRVGPRPASAGPKRFAVRSYDPPKRRTTITLPEDDWQRVTPGASLRGEGLPDGFVVGALELRVDGPRVAAEVHQA